MLRERRPGRAPASAAGFVAALTLTLAAGPSSVNTLFGATPKWEWEGVGRIVAIGDVHGRHDQLTAILQGTGLAGDRLRWTGEKDHLVLCGDLVGRGPDDRAVLDLVIRLQKQAESTGGRVHVVLGNHEVMNLVRDFRYVHPQGYAAFQADEKPGDRRKALAAYKKAFSGKGIKSAELRAAFDERYPPGYFARQRAFAPKGPYGSWLLKQPAVVKINGVLFVHGGLTPEVAALGIDGINDRVRKSVRSVTEAGVALDAVVGAPAGFGETRAVAAAVLKLAAQGRQTDPWLARAAETLTEEMDNLPFAPGGPLWYRGSSLANERTETKRVSTVLEQLNAASMVVGHTVTRNGRVSSRFNGRFLRSDVGMGYGRKGYAVVFEKNRASVFDPATRLASLPFVEPPDGESWASGCVHLADADLERFLSEAEVVERSEVGLEGQRAEVWKLRGEGFHLHGVFKDSEEERPAAGRVSSRRYEHEVAAYKLDRMLGLGLVPVVVLREAEASRGALRAVMETALDMVSLKGAGAEESIRAIAESYGLGVGELRDQVVRARVFDGLIGNQEREDRLFVPAEGHVCLMDHEQAFPLSTDLDPTLLRPCRTMPAALRNALILLDADELRSTLGEYLTEDQIDAVLKRRDRVLQVCGSAGPQSVGRGMDAAPWDHGREPDSPALSALSVRAPEPGGARFPPPGWRPGTGGPSRSSPRPVPPPRASACLR